MHYFLRANANDIIHSLIIIRRKHGRSNGHKEPIYVSKDTSSVDQSWLVDPAKESDCRVYICPNDNCLRAPTGLFNSSSTLDTDRTVEAMSIQRRLTRLVTHVYVRPVLHDIILQFLLCENRYRVTIRRTANDCQGRRNTHVPIYGSLDIFVRFRYKNGFPAKNGPSQMRKPVSIPFKHLPLHLPCHLSPSCFPLSLILPHFFPFFFHPFFFFFFSSSSPPPPPASSVLPDQLLSYTEPRQICNAERSFTSQKPHIIV